MGRKPKSLVLRELERAELENMYKNGKKQISKRCHMILLKSENRSSAEIAKILMTNLQSVNNWLERYEKEGLKGLETKKGQGRKAILNKEEDEKIVRKMIERERQRLSQIKEEIEKETGKEFSMKTLKRFLKNLTAVGNALD